MNFLSKIYPEVFGLTGGTAVVSTCSNPPSPCPFIFQGMAYTHVGTKAFSKNNILNLRTDEGILSTYQRHDFCYFICHHVQSMLYSCGRRMFHSLEKMNESLEGYSVIKTTWLPIQQAWNTWNVLLTILSHVHMLRIHACICKEHIFFSLLISEQKFPLNFVQWCPGHLPGWSQLI